MDLKEIRKEKKLTQQQSADILGISRRSYQTLEKEGAKENETKYEYYCGVLSGLYQKKVENSEKYLTFVKTGRGLEIYKDNVRDYKKRNCYSFLKDYIENDYTGKVCILYGLRRSGKTTMLFQLLSELDLYETAYIKIDTNNTMGDLIKDINRLTEKGIKNFLIDEITLLDDFINSASALSDIYCQQGQKIILSGTDSLGFDFAKRDELYDRAIIIHTSYITFKEFSTVLGITDVDKYIEYGGTMQKENMKFDDPQREDLSLAFREDESTRKYIDSAISQNIQRTLKNYSFGSNFYALKELYDKGELTNVINRLVENMNHEFLLSVIEERFKSHDLGSARQILFKRPNKEVQTALSEVNEIEVLERLKKIIHIKEREETTVKVTQEAINQIKGYLIALDLLKEIEVRYDDGTSEKISIITQPGMRYSITKALCYSLFEDPYFASISDIAQDEIIETIMTDVKGRMLEDIVLLESTYRKTKEEIVFKYKRKNSAGEIDMVKYDKANRCFRVYEIKHTDKMFPKAQCKYLNDKELINTLSNKYGELATKYVLYRGNFSGVEDGVRYENVGVYLRSLR